MITNEQIYDFSKLVENPKEKEVIISFLTGCFKYECDWKAIYEIYKIHNVNRKTHEYSPLMFNVLVMATVTAFKGQERMCDGCNLEHDDPVFSAFLKDFSKLK